MNELQVFNGAEFGSIRTLYVNDSTLFCGSDVAKALGYAIPTKAVNTHCKGVSKMEAPPPVEPKRCCLSTRAMSIDLRIASCPR